MKLILHSITHHKCPVSLREKLALDQRQSRNIMRQMHSQPQISEAIILNTCNRFEVYAYVEKDFDIGRYMARQLSQYCPQAGEVFREYARPVEAESAVEHLFRVAAGLDSQMLGEDQILGQIKRAYTQSVNCRMSKIVFHRLFHTAFRVGKAVRTHTDINCRAVSVSLAAVEIARESLELDNSSALLVGAGENAELAARYLLKSGLARLTVANRSAKAAQQLAQKLGTGNVVALEQIGRHIDSADLVICSTAAEKALIDVNSAPSLAKRKKPLLILDIAVPRDVDPAVGKLDNVTLYNIDDLDKKIESNRQMRQAQCAKAKPIIDDFADKFMAWYHSLNVAPVIRELVDHGKSLAREEARRYCADFGRENTDRLEIFAQSLVQKLLHGPIDFLKSGGDGEPSTEQLQAAKLIHKIFALSKDKS